MQACCSRLVRDVLQIHPGSDITAASRLIEPLGGCSGVGPSSWSSSPSSPLSPSLNEHRIDLDLEGGEKEATRALATNDVNGQDLSQSSHDEAVEAFRSAKEPIVVEVLRRTTSKNTSQPQPAASTAQHGNINNNNNHSNHNPPNISNSSGQYTAITASGSSGGGNRVAGSGGGSTYPSEDFACGSGAGFSSARPGLYSPVMKSRCPNTMVSIGTQTEEDFYCYNRPPTPPPGFYPIPLATGLYQPSSRRPVAFSPSADMGLTDIEMAHTLDIDDPFFDDRQYEMVYEEVVLRRASTEEKLGLTLCYGSLDDDLTDIFISEVDPYSIAGKDGRIKEGDQIVQINGVDVRSRSEAISLFSGHGTDISLTVARAQLQCDDGFMEEPNMVLDELHMDLLEKHHQDNMQFMASMLARRHLDEEGGTTDTGTTENSSQKHEKDSGVGRTDESTRNDESSEHENFDSESLITPPSTASKTRHYSNDSFLSGLDIPSDVTSGSHRSGGGVPLPPTPARGEGARKGSESSLERELAILNREMEEIQVECQGLVDNHMRQQLQQQSQQQQHQQQQQLQAAQQHMLLQQHQLLQLHGHPLLINSYNEAMLRHDLQKNSPRVVPRMGTRMEFAKCPLPGDAPVGSAKLPSQTAAGVGRGGQSCSPNAGGGGPDGFPVGQGTGNTSPEEHIYDLPMNIYSTAKPVGSSRHPGGRSEESGISGVSTTNTLSTASTGGGFGVGGPCYREADLLWTTTSAYNTGGESCRSTPLTLELNPASGSPNHSGLNGSLLCLTTPTPTNSSHVYHLLSSSNGMTSDTEKQTQTPSSGGGGSNGKPGRRDYSSEDSGHGRHHHNNNNNNNNNNGASSHGKPSTSASSQGLKSLAVTSENSTGQAGLRPGMPMDSESLQELYLRCADVMYTNRANLQHTISVQQKLFQQQMDQQARARGAGHQGGSPLLHSPGHSTPNSGSNEAGPDAAKNSPGGQTAPSDSGQMEWVVKRRPDGTRYITRRPVRSKMLKERAKKISEERCGMTTDDDAMSEMKTGRYWSKEDRKRHLEKAKDYKRKKEILVKAKMETLKEIEEKKEVNIVELSHRKMMKHKGKKVFDNFTTVKEMLAHGNKNTDGKTYNPLLSVTTV